MNTLRLLWKTWKGLAHKIANFQARFILSVFYFVVLTPFALRVKFFSDPLQLKRFRGWMTRDHTESDPLAMARKQY